MPKLQSVLTKANYINKTDVVTLLETFGNFRNICAASEQQMVLCPGIGEKKVKRLHRALHAPFMLGGEEESKELDYVNSDGSDVAFSNEFGSNATSTSDNVSTVKRPEAISGTAQATGSNFMVPPHPSTIGKEQRGKVFDPSSCAYVDRDR